MNALKSSSLSVFAGAAIAALALVAAGCSGQMNNGSAGLPATLPDAPAVAGHAALGRAAAAPAAAAGPDATIVVTIAVGAHLTAGKPVVALGLELDGKAKSFMPVNLSGAASPCKKHGKTVTCKVSLDTSAGSHWLTTTAYTSPLAGKKTPTPVSTNGMPVNAMKAKTQVGLSLYALPASVVVFAFGDGITGDVTDGFSVDRSVATGPSAFALFAVDGDGNAVVGPDTSTFTIKGSNAAFALTTPGPNQFALDASTIPAAASTTVTVTAPGSKCPRNCKLSFGVSVSALATPTPVASATPTPLASATPTPLASATPTPVPTATPTPVPTATPTPVPSPTTTPAIYITYSGATAGSVRAFDIQGRTRPLSGTWPNLGQPSAIGYNTTTSTFYMLTTGGTSPIASYDALGNPVALSDVFAMTPDALAVDNSNNRIYVGTHVGASNDAIDPYDALGNPVTGLSPGFTNNSPLPGPNSLAWDPDHSRLYVVNSTTNKIEAYNSQGLAIDVSTKFTQPTACAGACVPTAVAYAHYNVWPYVIWKNGSTYYVGVYGGSGSLKGSFTPTVSTPVAIAADDIDSRIYVLGAAGDVEATDEYGSAAQTMAGNFTPPAGAMAATGIAIIQPTVAGSSVRRAPHKAKPAGHAIRPHR